MEEFTQKWAIIAHLEDVSEGSEFYYTDVPLHVTLAGIFKIGHDGSWLESELGKVLAGQKPIIVTADSRSMFGPNKDVPVIRITKTPELISLHNNIHGWLIKSGAVYKEPSYRGDGYLPHATFQKSGSLNEGETRTLSSISIIDLFPNGDAEQRKVLKTFELE